MSRRAFYSGFVLRSAATAVFLSALPALAAPSLQERIDAAAPGDTLRVPAGHYPGNLVIDKPLTLLGDGWPHLQGDTTGKTVRILAPDVTLDGFHISHSGLNLSKDDAAIFVEGDRAAILNNRIDEALHGLYARGASHLRVENNRIRGIAETAVKGVGFVPSGSENSDLCAVGQNRRGNGIHFWNSKGNLIRGNVITDTRDGIYFSFTRECRIEGNEISRTRYGLHYMYSDQNYFSGNRFEDNVAGAALMFSKQVTVHGNEFVANQGPRAYGLLLHNVDSSMIQSNEMTGNQTGIYLQNSHANEIRTNGFERNHLGMRLTSSSTANLFQGNRIGFNLHNVDLAGRNNGNEWSENGRGNAWAGAADLDLDGDGVSEMPHRETDLFGRHREEFPMISLLSESPALKAIAFALQRAPVPGTHYITDEHPLTSRPQQSETVSTR